MECVNLRLFSSPMRWMPLNTLLVLKKRYLLKDSEQHIIETPRQLFQRVARVVSKGEANYKSVHRQEEVEEVFAGLG